MSDDDPYIMVQGDDDSFPERETKCHPTCACPTCFHGTPRGKTTKPNPADERCTGFSGPCDRVVAVPGHALCPKCNAEALSDTTTNIPTVPKEPTVAMLDNLREQNRKLRVALVASGACVVDDDERLVGGHGWPSMDTVSCGFCGDCYCSGGPECDALDGLTLAQAATEHKRVTAPGIEASVKLRRANLKVIEAAERAATEGDELATALAAYREAHSVDNDSSTSTSEINRTETTMRCTCKDNRDACSACPRNRALRTLRRWWNHASR